ncbi:hypothetical protein AUP68_02769 [Ilyonectria robusta]
MACLTSTPQGLEALLQGLRLDPLPQYASNDFSSRKGRKTTPNSLTCPRGNAQRVVAQASWPVSPKLHQITRMRSDQSEAYVS